MQRRQTLRLATAVTAAWLLSGHTPYRQWKVYRQKHLLIGSCKTDPPGYVLATGIAHTLVRWLPESSARASRAPDPRRIASLLASRQWQVSVLRRAEAADLVAGRGLFDTVGAVPVNGLFAMGEHLLVCRPDFPHRHGWLVAATLAENSGAIPGGVVPGGATLVAAAGTIPVHPGAKAYAAGDPLPPGAETPEAEAAHGHSG